MLVAKAFLVDFKHCKIDRIIRDALRKKELETIGVVYYRVIRYSPSTTTCCPHL